MIIIIIMISLIFRSIPHKLQSSKYSRKHSRDSIYTTSMQLCEEFFVVVYGNIRTRCWC